MIRRLTARSLSYATQSSQVSQMQSKAPEIVHPFGEECVEDITQFVERASTESFSPEAVKVLNEPIPDSEIEIKPDGNLYLPEVKYRAILLKAFGVGGWALIPRGPHVLMNRSISREYALVCQGKFVSSARGHANMVSNLFSPAAISENVKSNALMRVCKDLGIASQLWDKEYVDSFKSNYSMTYQENGRTVWRKK